MSRRGTHLWPSCKTRRQVFSLNSQVAAIEYVHHASGKVSVVLSSFFCQFLRARQVPFPRRDLAPVERIFRRRGFSEETSHRRRLRRQSDNVRRKTFHRHVLGAIKTSVAPSSPGNTISEGQKGRNVRCDCVWGLLLLCRHMIPFTPCFCRFPLIRSHVLCPSARR